MLEHAEHQTRTQATEAKYRRRAGWLIRRAIEGGWAKDESDVGGVTKWLAVSRPSISKSTFRQYKAALVFYYASFPDETTDTLRHLSGAGCFKPNTKSGPLRTSAQKMKRLPSDALDLLEDYFSRKTHATGKIVMLWLRAGHYYGVRPREWMSATEVYLPGGIHALRVENAKNTNARAHGKYRHLDLTAVPAKYLYILRAHLDNVREYAYDESSFRRFHNNCMLALWRATREIWPYRKTYPSLYSARHQFSADAKSSGHDPRETGAMMGHATDLTNLKHYGKRRYGTKVDRVGATQSSEDLFLLRPIREEVLRVKKVAGRSYRPATRVDGGRKLD